jgi:hypothetical protein
MIKQGATSELVGAQTEVSHKKALPVEKEYPLIV